MDFTASSSWWNKSESSYLRRSTYPGCYTGNCNHASHYIMKKNIICHDFLRTIQLFFLRHGLVYRGNIWSKRKKSLSVMSQKLPRARIWHFLIRDSSWSHREDQACLENNQSCNWQGIPTNYSATPFKINRKFKSTLVLVTASVNLSTLPLVCTTRIVQSTQGKVYFFPPILFMLSVNLQTINTHSHINAPWSPLKAVFPL